MHVAIYDAIKTTLAELQLPVVDFVVDYPTDKNAPADYFSNVALVLAKQVGKPPREIAEQIATVVTGKINQVASIKVAGPGFLNIAMERSFFTNVTAGVFAAGDTWGSHDAWKDEVVIVEYTDPNPFKELHIGHIVPNALGESLARLFMLAGADTKRVTFQGDVGMHVAKAMYGLQQLHATPETIDASLLGKAYATGSKAFEASEDIAAEIKALNKVIYEKTDTAINELYDAGKKASLEYFETAYQVLGSAFDHNFFESVTGPVGLALVQQHLGDVFTQSAGAVIFKGEKYGLHTRVFVNTEGLPTYETKDVGLIQCKEDWSKQVTGRSFDHTITVTGTEQQEYFKVTTKASTLIQPELAGKVELVPNGMLRLSEGKMSSRTGDVIRALDLVADVKTAALERMRENNVIDSEQVAQQVAVAAIKYTILKIAAGKDIVFDVNKSISFEGDSGPYLQYTYARIQSVLDKAAQAGVHQDTTLAPTAPYAVEKLVERFPTVIQTALTDRAPHQLVTYLTELAAEFNSFYAQEKIADPTDQYAPYKAAVAQVVGITLERGLWALGIEAPDRM